MATLAQTPQEITRKIDLLIGLLEMGLLRASNESNNEIKKIKYVYKTSILFYKELKASLNNPEFIDFINENLSEQLQEISAIFIDFLKNNNTSSEKVGLPLLRNSIGLFESRAEASLLAIYKSKEDKFREAGVMLFLWFLIGLVVFALTIVALPVATIISLPVLPIIASFAGILVMMLSASLLCERRQHRYSDFYSLNSNLLGKAKSYIRGYDAEFFASSEDQTEPQGKSSTLP
jgi:hypothetical protein